MTSVIDFGKRHPFKGNGKRCMQIVMNRMGTTSRCQLLKDADAHDEELRLADQLAADNFGAALAASIPADRRVELDVAELKRTTRWLEMLVRVSGHGADNPFTPRQLAAARRLVEGASADTLRTVVALLAALSDD